MYVLCAKRTHSTTVRLPFEIAASELSGEAVRTFICHLLSGVIEKLVHLVHVDVHAFSWFCVVHAVFVTCEHCSGAVQCAVLYSMNHVDISLVHLSTALHGTVLHCIVLCRTVCTAVYTIYTLIG